MKINNTWTEIALNYNLIPNTKMINLLEHNDKEYYLVLIDKHWELWRRDNNGKANVASPVKIFADDSFSTAKEWSNNYFNQRKSWAMTSGEWLYGAKEVLYAPYNTLAHNVLDNEKNIKLKNSWHKMESCDDSIFAALNPLLIYAHSSGNYFLIKTKRFDSTPHWELWSNYVLTTDRKENKATRLTIFNADIRFNDAKWWFNNSQYNSFTANH